MAYLPESEIEKQQRLQQGGTDTGGADASTSGPSGGIINTGAGSTNQAPGQPTHSGAFTNINQYIDANRDQGAGLATDLAGKIGTTAENAKGELSGLQNDFNSQVDKGSVQRDQGWVSDAVKNPTATANDPNQLQRFTNMRTAQYTGPTDLTAQSNYGQTQNDLQNAQNSVDDTKTESGRFSQLQKNFATPTYNRGQQRLDQSILQNAPEARTTLENLQNQYSGINGMLNPAVEASQQKATQAKQDTQGAAQDVQNALFDPTTGALPQFQQGLDARVASAKQNAMDQYTKDQQAFANGTVDDETLSRYGFNPDQQSQFRDLLGRSVATPSQNGTVVEQKLGHPSFDFSKYLGTPNVGMLNDENVATADDYSNYTGLAKLAGIDPTLLRNSALAGTGKINPNYNVANMLSDAKTAIAPTIPDEINNLFARWNNPNVSFNGDEKDKLESWIAQNPNSDIAKKYRWT